MIATGSEVGIAAEAVNAANAAGRRVRLVSMPCTEVFDAQDEAYRESVLPRAVTRAPGRRGRRDASPGGATSAATGACSASTSFGASGKARRSVPTLRLHSR